MVESILSIESKGQRIMLVVSTLKRYRIKLFLTYKMLKILLVRLYQKYISKCPDDPVGGFVFLQALSSPTSTRWYTNRVVGYNTLAGVVKKLCTNGGIKGRKTNHSL